MCPTSRMLASSKLLILISRLVTIPHRSLVEVRNVEGKRIKLPYTSTVGEFDVFHCKAISHETIYPRSTLNMAIQQ